MSGIVTDIASRDLEDLTRALNAVIDASAPLMDRVSDATLDAILAERDCSCTTHHGPHWLHADQIWRERNADLLMRSARETDAAKAVALFRSYVAEELARMQSYRRALEQRVAKEPRAIDRLREGGNE